MVRSSLGGKALSPTKMYETDWIVVFETWISSNLDVVQFFSTQVDDVSAWSRDKESIVYQASRNDVGRSIVAAELDKGSGQSCG